MKPQYIGSNFSSPIKKCKCCGKEAKFVVCKVFTGKDKVYTDGRNERYLKGSFDFFCKDPYIQKE